MRRLVKSVLLAAVILVTGCLASACAQAASGATISDSPSASAPATATAPSTPTPAPPTTAPSTVSSPTATVTITTTPATPASSSPGSSTVSGSDLVWLWVILGALALLGIILWATRSSSRPFARAPAPAYPPTAAGWHSRAADAYAQGAALDGAVRAADQQGAFAEPAGERWYDIRRLADDLAQTLYAMRETAPSEERRAQVARALASLEAVRYAVDADRTITVEDADPEEEASVHSSLAALESSLNALRVPEGRYQ
jgi:hypothetical protein